MGPSQRSKTERLKDRSLDNAHSGGALFLAGSSLVRIVHCVHSAMFITIRFIRFNQSTDAWVSI